MKMLKVTNYVEKVSRLSLEKLGFSTKRDNEETIGQFGSGIKFAPIAAIRQGKKFVFTGSDNRGEYALEYVVREEDGIDCVFYKYGDYEKPSSFTVNAGSLSWEKPFQIYREVVANAIDEAKLSGTDWNSEIVDVEEIRPVAGEFSVYISATDDIIEIHNNFDHYFSVNRESCYEGYDFKLYQPIDDNFRVYSKGVLIFSGVDYFNGSNEFCGLFDYEFDNIKLNEERTVNSVILMQNMIANALGSVNNVYLIKNIIQQLLDNDLGLFRDSYYEIDGIPEYNYSSSNCHDKESPWSRAFDFVYPNSALLKKEDASINARASVESRGYDPLVISKKNIFYLLQKQGVRTAYDVAGNGITFDYTMDISEYKDLNLALRMIYHVFGDRIEDVRNRIGVFTPKDDTIVGITTSIEDNSERIILISKNHALNGGVRDIIGTIMHEYDHLIHQVGDGDYEGRAFRSLADMKIGWLVFNSWWNTQIGVTQQMIEEERDRRKEM